MSDGGCPYDAVLTPAVGEFGSGDYTLERFGCIFLGVLVHEQVS